MADIELVIKIPKEAKIAFDRAESNDLKGSYYDFGGVIGKAIANGKPLDDMFDALKEEIMQLGYNLDCEYDDMERTVELHMICREEVLQIIDEYKAKGSDKE